MSVELEPVKNRTDFANRVEGLRELDSATATAGDAVVLSDIGGGLLKFAGAAFPVLNIDGIYAKMYEREPEGRGAHFDVYGDTLNPDYPWLAVYNLAGKVSLNALKLPDSLAESYFRLFPEADEKAFQARRDYSSIAMKSSGEEIYTAMLDPDMGLVIAQDKEGPHIIHDIVPEDPDNPGKFVKLVCPDSSKKKTMEAIKADGMVPLDKLVSSNLAHTLAEYVLPEADRGSPAPKKDCGPGLLD